MDTLEEIKKDIEGGFLTNPLQVYNKVLTYFQTKQAGKTKRVIVCNRCAGDWDQSAQQKHLSHYGQPTVVVESV